MKRKLSFGQQGILQWSFISLFHLTPLVLFQLCKGEMWKYERPFSSLYSSTFLVAQNEIFGNRGFSSTSVPQKTRINCKVKWLTVRYRSAEICRLCLFSNINTCDSWGTALPVKSFPHRHKESGKTTISFTDCFRNALLIQNIHFSIPISHF